MINHIKSHCFTNRRPILDQFGHQDQYLIYTKRSPKSTAQTDSHTGRPCFEDVICGAFLYDELRVRVKSCSVKTSLKSDQIDSEGP